MPHPPSRVSASSVPMAIAAASIDEPPYEMNGRVIPLAGNSRIATAMLTKACNPNS